MAKTNNRDDDVVTSALEVLGGDDLPEVHDAETDTPLVDGDGDRIPDNLIFTTADDDDDDDELDDDDVREVKLDGISLWATKPSKGAWSMVLGAVSQAATQADKTQAVLSFVYASFDPPSQILIKERMMNPRDKFDIGLLSKIVSQLIEYWAPQQSRAQRRASLRHGKNGGRRAGARS